MMKLLRYISFGGFTNGNEYKKHPFYQLPNELLEKDRKRLEQRLRMCDVPDTAVRLFHIAFTHFKNIPYHYDGASGDVELHKIHSRFYDIGAIIHDYPDVTNYTTTIDRVRLADKALIKLMEELGDADIHVNKRKLVSLLAPVRFMLSRKRRTKPATHPSIYHELLTQYVDDYSIDYLPLIKYGIIITSLLILIITHPFIKIIIDLI